MESDLLHREDTCKKLASTKSFVEEMVRLNNDVLRRIAKGFEEKSELTMTEIHLTSRLRWDSFVSYFNFLQKNNHIASRNVGPKPKFYLTPRGQDMFENLHRFLDSLGETGK